MIKFIALNNKEFISELSNRLNYTIKDTSDLVQLVTAAMIEQLQAGNIVSIQGFGSFEVKKKAERISVNPANGKRYLVPPKLVPVFKPGTTVKNRLKELGDHE